MGEVYRAHDPRLDREVAIKILYGETSREPDRLRRFEQEARATSALNHPGILAVYDFGIQDATPYVVAELLEGETLRNRLGAGRMGVRKAIEHAVEIAEALAAAHQKGIVHRDIKPENLFLTRDGRIKILDFGLAKLRDRPRNAGSEAATVSQITESGVMLGTVGYVSPEQIRGTAVDHRTDIFSFGVVLFEMLLGQRPFQRDTNAETMTAILHDDPPEPSSIGSSIPAGLERIVRRCLEKRPEDRFQSARDLAFALEALSGSSPSTTGARSLAVPPERPVSSHLRAVLALMAAGLVGLTLAGWYVSRSGLFWKNPLAGARFSRFTDWEGSEVNAAVSRDGKFVAFLSDRDGIFDAWVSQVGGSEFVNLTRGRFPQLFSDGVPNIGFSHDGAHVWLRVSGRTPAEHSVWLVPTIGGAPRPFLPAAVSVEWSPDGSEVLYHEPGPGDPVFIADRDGGNPRRLTRDPPGHHWHYPTWAPDGRSVYFSGGLSPDEMDLWRLSASNGDRERLTHHQSRVAFPTMLDAGRLLYTETGISGSTLHVLDLARGTSHRVSFGLEEYTSVAASADGRRVVATVANPSRTLWTVPISDDVQPESAASRLTIPIVRADHPRVGPDYLLFLSSRGSRPGLWVFKDGTVSELWKSSAGGVEVAPAVSPDGQRICFAVRKEGRARLHLMAADGTNVQPLAPALDVREAPSWSPDGRWIAVSASEGAQAPLYKVPVDGGAPVRLVEGIVLNPVWSPDGKLIVYSEFLQGAAHRLRAVSTEGTSISVPDLFVLWSGDRYRFMPGGGHLVIMQGHFRRQDFWRLDLETGGLRRLTNLRPGYDMKSFDISPDGRQIVFDRVRENSDIVLIDLPR